MAAKLLDMLMLYSCLLLIAVSLWQRQNLKMTIENLAVFGGFILYLIAAGSFAYKNNWAWAMIWFCYAMANVGLIWASLKK